jgi:hypothetical protein
MNVVIAEKDGIRARSAGLKSRQRRLIMILQTPSLKGRKNAELTSMEHSD